MLQRDIQTPDLDVSWVSALSWYFLTLFGLNAVYSLVLGGENCKCPPFLHSRPDRLRVLVLTQHLASA